MDRTRKFTVRKQNKWFQDWLDTAVGIVLGLPAEYRLPQWRFSCCLILQYYVSRRASVLLGIIRKEGWGLSCDLMHWLDAWTRVTRQQLTGSLVKESCRSIALNLRFAKQMAAILQCYWSHSRKWPINRCQKKPVIWNATTNLVSWKSKSTDCSWWCWRAKITQISFGDLWDCSQLTVKGQDHSCHLHMLPLTRWDWI